MKNILILGLCVLAATLSSGGVSGAVLSVAPSEVVMLPIGDTGMTRAAMSFDLSEIQTGPGRQIVSAVLDWSLDGLSDSETPAVFTIHRAMEAWSPEMVAQAQGTIAYEAEPADTWTLEALDFERLGGFLRFRIPGLVEDWLNDPSSNHGVVVTFTDSAPDGLQAQLGQAKLTVRYIFVPVEEQ